MPTYCATNGQQYAPRVNVAIERSDFGLDLIPAKNIGEGLEYMYHASQSLELSGHWWLDVDESKLRGVLCPPKEIQPSGYLHCFRGLVTGELLVQVRTTP